MLGRRSIGAIALAAALTLTLGGASAFDDAKHPNLKGQWTRFAGGGQWDPTKPPGRGQQAPLTEEYVAVMEAGIASQRSGGQGVNSTPTCLPPGMPRAMIVYEPMEVVVTPELTYILIEFMHQIRRVYTDGRDWPEQIEPSFAGYSIGRWEDSDGDGRYDVLAVETRGMKGPRSFDGIVPLHKDNLTIVKERIYLDKTDPNVLHDEVTTIDSALTRPWTVTRNYRREKTAQWFEYICAEDNHHVFLGKENYFVSEDGYLLPTRKDQPAPDLKFFSQSRK
jgi:hypothetical protein